MADLHELNGADRFRVNAHSRAAQVIKDLSTDLSTLVGDTSALTEIEGIGERTAEKIIEYHERGKVTEHEDLLEQVPRGLVDVLAVPGLGPKTVRLLWKEKGITSLDDLKEALEKGELSDVPRMGKKTIENIRESLAFMEAGEGRTPIGIAMPIAEAMVERLAALESTNRVRYAGSLRRGQETIGDVDVIITTSDPAEAQESFVSMDEVTKVLARGETKCSVRLAHESRPIQADLRIMPDESFGAALLYFTGSKDYNIRLREIAIGKGMTLNEYGLFEEAESSDEPPQSRGVEPVASRTEEDVCEALGVPWRPPELRSGTDVEAEPPADLITVEDVACELHAHTTASDGKLSIEELAECAKDRGFHTIAVTDHSQSSVIANGLEPDRLRAHMRRVREADESVRGITILAGTEVDILPDGTLDYEDELLAELDVVVASPHTSLRQSDSDATDRLISAIENPHVHIIGHPCGRLIKSREGLSPDIRAVSEAAAANGVALEINANWHRLDLRDAHVRTALEAGALIAIDCDVHRSSGFENLRYGVLTGRRGGLPAPRCVNTWGAKKLRDWLRSRRESG